LTGEEKEKKRERESERKKERENISCCHLECNRIFHKTVQVKLKQFLDSPWSFQEI